ncbi:MAG TPA: hypothetical protein VL156_05215 [Terriglobales bacterium]|jgi:hypothetical protein|nr:hypothetical protein [Terriglobales bacterium]
MALLRKCAALHNTDPNVNGSVAIVQLTLNEHFQILIFRSRFSDPDFQIQQITIAVPGSQNYSIALSDTFKSKGSYRPDRIPGKVRAFTMSWNLNLVIPVFKKSCDAEACKLLNLAKRAVGLYSK